MDSSCEGTKGDSSEAQDVTIWGRAARTLATMKNLMKGVEDDHCSFKRSKHLKEDLEAFRSEFVSMTGSVTVTDGASTKKSCVEIPVHSGKRNQEETNGEEDAKLEETLMNDTLHRAVLLWNAFVIFCTCYANFSGNYTVRAMAGIVFWTSFVGLFLVVSIFTRCSAAVAKVVRRIMLGSLFISAIVICVQLVR